MNQDKIQALMAWAIITAAIGAMSLALYGGWRQTNTPQSDLVVATNGDRYCTAGKAQKRAFSAGVSFVDMANGLDTEVQAVSVVRHGCEEGWE